MSLEKKRMAKNIFGWFFARFMKSVHIELPYETINVSMSKIFGENGLLKFLNVFDGEFFSIRRPLNDRFILFVLC